MITARPAIVDSGANVRLPGTATFVTVACPCGVTFERWVTPWDAELDLLRAAALN